MGASFGFSVMVVPPAVPGAQIEQMGYTIIANVGDQPSDLIGGHAEKMFLLPDPFYRVP